MIGSEWREASSRDAGQMGDGTEENGGTYKEKKRSRAHLFDNHRTGGDCNVYLAAVLDQEIRPVVESY
jgi:hypothetical protein